MIRSILVSAVLHGLFIVIILFSSAIPYESGDFVNNRISVRIVNNPNTKHSPSAVKSKNPPRNLATVPRKNVINAREGGGMDDESAIDDKADELAALLDYEPLVPPRSKPGEPVQSLNIADPLVNFDEQSGVNSSSFSPWLINWIDGRERGILSFPVVDSAQFPQETEKLLNVVMKIRVSPQGEVLSAELIPPGSGDTRIDRYLHAVALQLTLEPLFENGRVQEAHLHLLFLEDSL